jgi:hypothetical protein
MREREGGTTQLWSRGSLLHPQEKGLEGESRGSTVLGAGIGALPECVFFSEPLLFE